MAPARVPQRGAAAELSPAALGRAGAKGAAGSVFNRFCPASRAQPALGGSVADTPPAEMPLSSGPAGQPAAPRFALGFAALACLTGAMTLGYPALAGRFLASPISDQYVAGYAFREFAAASLRETGTFPLWNPYLFGGMPFVAAMHGDVFYPTFLLRMVMRTDAAMTWGLILHVWLAGVLTYAFLRSCGFGFYGALLGGVAYELSGQLASLVAPGHDGKLFVSALFPLTLWMLQRGVRDGRASSWGALALAVGLAMVSPHPQLTQYMLLGSGAFALYLARSEVRGGRVEQRVAVRRLSYALGAVLIGLGIGAIQYLPVIEYVDWSPRAGGLRTYELATALSIPPDELINGYLPQFTGMLDQYWGRNGTHFHSEYLGVGVLLLAGVGIGAGWGVEERRRSFALFWLGALLVALLWALGGHTPFYRLVYALVPGTKFFRAPSTVFFIVSFASAVLACLGAERLLERKVGTWYYVGWVGAAGLVAVLALSGGLTNVAAAIAGPERHDLVAANSTALARGAVRAFVFVAVTAGAGLAYLRGHLGQEATALALIAVVATDLWTVAHRYWLFSPPAAALYAPDQTIDYVLRQPEPGRVLALQLSADAATRDPFLRGNALMSHGIRQALGHHGNELGRYQELTRQLENLGNPNFWALYNVRYLLTNVAEPPVQGATRVVGPVSNARGSAVYLYEMPGDNPAAWVAPAIDRADDASVRETMLNPLFPVRSTALFDSAAAVTPRADLAKPPKPLTIKPMFSRYAPGRISVSLDAPAPRGSALVVSENYYPGWRATVDGRAAGVARADYTLIGVPLPEGARQIELSFVSESFEAGKEVTRAAIGAATLLLLGGLLVDWRRRV